jgi:hypothetical protein
MTKKQLLKNLKQIIRMAKEYEIDAHSQIDGYGYLMSDLEELVNWNPWKDEDITNGKEI